MKTQLAFTIGIAGILLLLPAAEAEQTASDPDERAERQAPSPQPRPEGRAGRAGGPRTPQELPEAYQQAYGRGAFPPTRAEGAYVGVTATPAPAALRAHLELEPGMGLLVQHVAPDSPAAEAGIQQYDVLIRMEDQHLANENQLAALLRGREAGEEVRFELIRRAEAGEATVTLAEQPQVARPRGVPFQQPPRGPRPFQEGGFRQARVQQLQEQLEHLREHVRPRMEGEEREAVERRIERLEQQLQRAREWAAPEAREPEAPQESAPPDEGR